MDIVGKPVSALKVFINSCAGQREPWEIVTITTTSVLAAVWFWQFVFQEESVHVRAKKAFFKLLRKVPAVRNKLKAEIEKISDKFMEDAEKRVKDIPFVLCLPDKGAKDEEVLRCVEKCVELGEFDWKHGFVSGAVYFQSQPLLDLVSKVYGQTSYTNPLHPDVFPGINKMEAEVVRITAQLFHGGPNSCGTMTSGGTESILMACKALRDFAYHERGIRRGEIVLPKTAHPAFDKAAQYLDMKITYVPVDPKTCTVDIKQMEKAISKNTVMLVGSVPNYPYGTSDDMEAIAALGRKYNIPVHSDCCLGGFLTAFMPSVGYPVAPFDFAVDGIVSISADTHKYGYTPKGSSVVLYCDEKYRSYQYTVTTDWPGGVYGSPTVNGSRPGGTIAVTWASMMHFGLEGYKDATKKVISTSRHLEKKLREIEELTLFGTPATSVVAFRSEKFHIYKLAEILKSKQWNINSLQFPPGIHMTVTVMHTVDGVIDRFVEDVKLGVQQIMTSTDLQELTKGGEMALYGMAQSLPDRTIVEDITCAWLDSLYFTPKQSEKHSSQNGHI
ncbi:sphingosine-1-phosphate lyase-like [Macrosteles quadrilineatus]|uniref:sphingosine-1-phosphate lyase-like n=1 Tax=Macrosteles quadrilineatus TaxID=74068 RepID=UPI0023E0FEB8|nr:sphingosine-1-phosphate lyase-like [Macrosteles quadrilineatus]